MFNPFESVFGSEKNRRSIINDVVATRNYLTHFDSKLENDARSGAELWRLCNKLEVLFEVQLLQRLGFTGEEIRSLAENSEHIKRKLNPYL